MKVGLIGEDPYDTSSIKILLEKRYASFNFKSVFSNMRGGDLKSQKFIRMLSKGVEATKISSFQAIIVIADLDGLESETAKWKEVQNWYKKVASSISIPSDLLLNIYELEALLLADTDALGKFLNCKIPFKANPEFQIKPKEYIREIASQNKTQFSVSDCPKVFATLAFDKVHDNCSSFKRFIADFENLKGKLV